MQMQGINCKESTEIQKKNAQNIEGIKYFLLGVFGWPSCLNIQVLTAAQVMISGSVGASLVSGSVPTAWSLLVILSLSLCLSLSQNK